jgi:hypothetical protein
MQSFRIEKPKPRKSSKPSKGWHERRIEIAESISVEDNIAMVACSECVNHGVVCYYDREQSVKCAACLRNQRTCDGTFSMEEFRKVGEQKKQLVAKTRAKRREIARLRKVLAEAEGDEADLEDSLAVLEEKSSKMLQREMLALGVMSPLDNEQEVAWADPGFVWEGMPATDSVDWDLVLRPLEGASGSQGSVGGTQLGA